MVSNVFVVDQGAQAHNIYLIIYVCVGNCGSRCQRIYIELTKNSGFPNFFEILRISLKIPSISNSSCKIPSILKFLIQSTQYFDLNTAIPHINSETNPPSPIFHVVCKYLRQFLGTIFGVAILPICCNIEQGKGPDLFL